jgi:hypothetical protein
MAFRVQVRISWWLSASAKIDDFVFADGAKQPDQPDQAQKVLLQLSAPHTHDSTAG